MVVYIILLLLLTVIIKEIIIAKALKNYPLDTLVEMKINRELMNNQYELLSEEEKEILNLTSDPSVSVYITREVTNKLVVTANGENIETKRWTIYQPKEISNKWIRCLKEKNYLTRKKKLIFCKR